MSKILITWGAWYIWSHIVVELEESWIETVIVDNFSNSKLSVLEWIEYILWYFPTVEIWDILDEKFMESVFEKYDIEWVVHLAWLKSVKESCNNPWLYHYNNIEWSISLFRTMEKFNVRNIIFSSSATVYDCKNASPMNESMSLWTTNPYWNTKKIIEEILQDYARFSNWSIISLRYFNPIWAHESWRIGELPNWVPNNLMPYILDVAIWKEPYLRIYGRDYETRDWTWVRDYIDVQDLANAHLKAYKKIKKWFLAINIGTWKWTSVLEMVSIFEWITRENIPYKILPRRDWDIAELFADASLAREFLGWESERTIEESLKNSLKFKKNWLAFVFE